MYKMKDENHEDYIDALKYSLESKEEKQVLKRIECEGVGDNNGFYELTFNE